MPLFTPCCDSQSLYRTLLMAASHPGRRHSVEKMVAADIEDALLLALATCLMDHEVSFALTGQWGPAIGQDISHQTGSRSAERERADFVFVSGGTSQTRVAQAKRGSLSYPDRGATVIYCLDARTLNEDFSQTGKQVYLSGPGIERPCAPQLEGLSLDEYRLLAEVNGNYPLGVDTFVIKENRYIMGLPRSTRIEVN